MTNKPKICPICQRERLKTWNELTPDEKFAFEKLSPEESSEAVAGSETLFCPRCRYTEKPDAIYS